MGYLRSCWRESIKGGTVTVGAAQSEVAGGTVRREKVEFDSGCMRLTQAQSGQAGVMVFRAPPRAQGSSAVPQRQATLFGLSPVLDVRGGGTVTIERIDQPGDKLTVEVGRPAAPARRLPRPRQGKQPLVAGGVYRASVSPEREIVFKVDTEAKPGQAPIVSRLLRL